MALTMKTQRMDWCRVDIMRLDKFGIGGNGQTPKRFVDNIGYENKGSRGYVTAHNRPKTT